jgi:hypothetical protein
MDHAVGPDAVNDPDERGSVNQVALDRGAPRRLRPRSANQRGDFVVALQQLGADGVPKEPTRPADKRLHAPILAPAIRNGWSRADHAHRRVLAGYYSGRGGGEEAAIDSDPRSTDEGGPRSAAVTFVTTEHFVLQGARAATIAESTGRANMFLAAVSGGLVALGLVATASSLGAAFYGFGLVLLPTLAFVGFVTFERALQSSIEDTEYARRIALLRGYYFEHAPGIAPYVLSVPPAERLLMQRVPGDRWQGYRTVAGMVAVITAVLAGSTAALAAILIFDHSLAAAVISGTLVALPTMIAMIRYQNAAWERAAAEPLRPGED